MLKENYDRICDLVYREAGIRIRPGKESMVSARLSKRIRQLRLADDSDYVEHLERELDTEVVQLLDLISTNVTHFYRESEHFAFVARQHAKWLAQGQRRFRYWCAATATGEEPYTLAMTLADATAGRTPRPDVRILATDISTRALAQASQGVYSEDRLEGIPESQRRRWLRPVRNAGQPTFQFEDELKRMILFKRLNLSKPPFPMRGPLDVVFCRNVMFYFDDPVKERLVGEIHRLLRPDGFLIVGKSESVPALRNLFERVGPSIYEKT